MENVVFNVRKESKKKEELNETMNSEGKYNFELYSFKSITFVCCTQPSEVISLDAKDVIRSTQLCNWQYN